jgi:hypothetical protein
MTEHRFDAGKVAALLVPLLLLGCDHGPESGKVQDEARRAGRTPESFAAADDPYFHEMDGGAALTLDEVKGRNTWIVWTGGNDRFWDSMTNTTFGAFDLLKTVSSHPALKANRDNRWTYLGLINEPCFDKPTGPDPERFGLWLDKRRADCPPDAKEREEKLGVDFDAVYKRLFQPSLEAAGLQPFRADDEVAAGDILKDMFAELVTADFVLADISILNANVFYEVGICHALDKSVLLLAQSMDDVPFDLRHRRVPDAARQRSAAD